MFNLIKNCIYKFETFVKIVMLQFTLKVHNLNNMIFAYYLTARHPNTQIPMYVLEKHHSTNKGKVSRSSKFIYGFIYCIVTVLCNNLF